MISPFKNVMRFAVLNSRKAYTVGHSAARLLPAELRRIPVEIYESFIIIMKVMSVSLYILSAMTVT